MGKKPQILKAHLVTPPADPGSNPAEGEIFFLHFFYIFFYIFCNILVHFAKISQLDPYCTHSTFW